MKKMEKNENNKVDFDLLKDFLNKNDIFAAYIGGKIVEIAPGYAKAEMNIEERLFLENELSYDQIIQMKEHAKQYDYVVDAVDTVTAKI